MHRCTANRGPSSMTIERAACIVDMSGIAGPGGADLDAGHGDKPLHPALRRIRRRAQIGHCRRDGFEPRFEQRAAGSRAQCRIDRAPVRRGRQAPLRRQNFRAAAPPALAARATSHGRRAPPATGRSGRIAACRPSLARPSHRCACRRGCRLAMALSGNRGPLCSVERWRHSYSSQPSPRSPRISSSRPSPVCALA